MTKIVQQVSTFSNWEQELPQLDLDLNSVLIMNLVKALRK